MWFSVMLLKRALFSVVLLAFPCGYATADIVADAGLGPGAPISVATGTLVTVKVVYLPSALSAPIAFDGVGLDLNWTPTGTGVATPAGPSAGFLFAGLAAGAPVLSDDLLTPGGAGSVVPSSALTNLSVAPGAGVFSIGGGAHFDTAGSAILGVGTGNSYGVPSGTAPLDLMGAEFLITGMTGDTITFTPSGILIGGVGYPSPSAVPGGNHYYTNSAPGTPPGIATGMDPIIGSVVVTVANLDPDTDGDGDPDSTDPDDDNDGISDANDLLPLIPSNNCTTNDGTHATLAGATVSGDQTCAAKESVVVDSGTQVTGTGDLRVISNAVRVGEFSIGENGRLEVINADPCEGCPPPPPTVFVTSTTYSGALGGLAGADEKCQTRANAAGLLGAWVAWLSTGNSNARDRIGDTTYRRTDGAIVATSLADLTDGNITNPINIDEFGTTVSGVSTVWTDTDGGGTEVSHGLANCGEWTSSSPHPTVGVFGQMFLTTFGWTNGDFALSCNNGSRLYCFVGPSGP